MRRWDAKEADSSSDTFSRQIARNKYESEMIYRFNIRFFILLLQSLRILIEFFYRSDKRIILLRPLTRRSDGSHCRSSLLHSRVCDLARKAQLCAYRRSEICYWISTRLNLSPNAPVFSSTIRRGDPEMHSDDAPIWWYSGTSSP